MSGNEVTHFSSARPPPRAGIARKSPYGGLSRYTPSPASPSRRREAHERVADPLDRRPATYGRQHGSVGQTGSSGIRSVSPIPSDAGWLTAARSSEIVAPGASPEEAAAVVAALERFMRATRRRPPARCRTATLAAAALYEGPAREQSPPPPWA